MTSTVIRIKRKVGDDPQHALLATKRRRLDAGDAAEAGAPGGSSDGGAQSALLQFVGTMAPEDTVLPDAALDAVRAQRKAAAARRDPASIAAAVERAREARRERLQEEQKARRYRIVSRRRGAPEDDGDADTAEDAGLASLPGVIDVEEEHPATTTTSVTEPASTSAGQEQLTCNGQVLERVSLAPAAATSAEYVYDLYVSSAPLAEDDDLLELRPCDEVQLWDHRAARDSDSDDPFADEDDDSNDEQNWRNDYPDELGDSDYERYMDPDTGAEFDLIRRMEAHEIGGTGGAGGEDSDDEPLAYGLDELEAGGAAGDDPYDKYKARVLKQLRGDDSDDDGDAGYLADSPDGSGDEEDF